MHRSPPDGRLSRRRLGLGQLARPRTLGILGVLACAGAAMLPTGAAVDHTSSANAAPANAATGAGNGFVVTAGDLTYILKRDWAKLGPKVRGKMRIYVGDMDNYYLNNAVYLTEQVLKGLSDPPADAIVDYGDRDEHCWNGDHTRANAYSRLRYAQMTFPWFVERMLTTAPAGADLRSWRY